MIEVRGGIANDSQESGPGCRCRCYGSIPAEMMAQLLALEQPGGGCGCACSELYPVDWTLQMAYIPL